MYTLVCTAHVYESLDRDEYRSVTPAVAAVGRSRRNDNRPMLPELPRVTSELTQGLFTFTFFSSFQ